MRVLVLASHFPLPGNPVMGRWALSQAHALVRHGLELRVVSLTSWLPRALARRGGRLAAWAAVPPEHRWDGVDVVYPRWPLYHRGPHHSLDVAVPQLQLALVAPWAGRAVGRELRAFAPDVVYAQGVAVNGHLARRTGLPYVLTEHDLGELRACARHPARRRHYARILGDAQLAVAVSHAMEAELVALFPHARTRTVHNGADPPAVPAATERADGRRIVLAVGALVERKAFPLLVDAFGRIARRHPDALLRVAGDGPQRPQVERAIAAHRLEGRVELVGELPHDDVLREMARADVFALVGWDEPFATVYLEAMAAGTPVVCCSDGGIVDVVEDGVHGRVVPPRDAAAAAAALDELLGDESRRRAMGAAARRLVVDRLTWDRHAAEMADILRAAVDQRP